jgi:hypothetical protein
MDGVVLLGEFPLRPPEGMPPRHSLAQAEPAAHLRGNLADSAPIAAHPLAQLVTLCLR